MKIILSVLLLFAAGAIAEDKKSTQPQVKTLDELLLIVEQKQGKQGKINREREAQFTKKKLQQRQLLQKAKTELGRQKKLYTQLTKQQADGEKILLKMASELKNKAGKLHALFGVAKHAAGDLQADISQSLVSTQFPGRDTTLSAIADSQAVPSIDQLQTLWLTLQQEIIQSGKVVSFDAQVEQLSGKSQTAKVIRIGTFNALSNGAYLQFSADTSRLTQLAKQPDSYYLNLAQDMMETKSGITSVGIDPTKGVILSMLVHTPNILERVQQGGIIGWTILLLGALAFAYGLLRLFTLTATDKKITTQLGETAGLADNPLGRIFATYEKNKTASIDNLELILDEAITKELPPIEKGLPTIKLVAAVAPLLGLLGTVTGMIATFQAISLFGTGDPKLMASGISQALVTTMLGLCVAIPLLFLHSLLLSRSRNIVQILEQQSIGLVSRRAGK